jgi:phage terminase small subunit
MIPNKKHQIFADEYVLTSDAIKAYQKAYPKAQPESARVKSYNLLQDVTIATYIKQKQDKIRLERENSQIEAVKQEASSNILQREKALEMMSNVAKLMYNQLAKNVDKKPADVMAFNATIESLRKMDGWDKATKQDVTLMRGADELFFHE